MLLKLDAVTQRRFIVIRKHGHRHLVEDAPGVHPFIHHVNGAPGDRDPSGKHVPVGVSAGKRRQKRRVNVDDKATPRLQKGWTEKTHVPRENHQFHPVTRQRIEQGRFMHGPGGGARVVAVVKTQGCHAQCIGLPETGCLRSIGDDHNRGVTAVRFALLMLNEGHHAAA